MINCFFLITLLASPVMLKPRNIELDKDEQQLLRAAFDTPAYDHDEYQEGENIQLGNLDLLKDGLWVVKAKIKELKAFNKALAANLLLTKLKVKELLTKHSHKTKHEHETTERKKVFHKYQPLPTYERPIPQNDAYHYQHDPYYGY